MSKSIRLCIISFIVGALLSACLLFTMQNIGDTSVNIVNVVDERLNKATRVIRSFVELECSIISVEGLDNLDDIAKIMTPECYTATYEYNERLMALPEKSSLKIKSVDSVVVQPNTADGSFDAMVMLKESAGTKVYPSTYVISLTSDYLVDEFVKVPHLK